MSETGTETFQLFPLVPRKETPMAPLVDPREKAEKGLSSLNTPGDRFAYWLSQITSPFVVGLGVFGYVSLSTASAVTEGLQWLPAPGSVSGRDFRAPAEASPAGAYWLWPLAAWCGSLPRRGHSGSDPAHVSGNRSQSAGRI